MPKFASTLPLLLGLVALGPAVRAQMPRTISFQGVLADGSGKIVPDGNHTLTLRLYDVAAGGSPIFTETQTGIPVVQGIFNAIIGSVSAIPTSLAFDRAYFLGVSVDNGGELSPRTALTAAPYALRASFADQAGSLAPGAIGVVTSINGGDGAVVLQGSGSTTINRTGNTITISSSGGSGGTGIQGVQSPGSSLAIANGNGPVASVDIADGGVTTPLFLFPETLLHWRRLGRRLRNGRVYALVNTVIDPSPRTTGLTLPAILVRSFDTMLRVSYRQALNVMTTFCVAHNIPLSVASLPDSPATAGDGAMLDFGTASMRASFETGRSAAKTDGFWKAPSVRLEPWEEWLEVFRP